MRLSLIAVLLAVPFAIAEEPEPKDRKIVAREIEVKGLPSARGALGQPVKITSKEELDKAVGKELSETIAKQVDLKKEFLLLFQWSGSGGDRLTLKQDKDSVSFDYLRGRTRDLRMHAKLFALPTKTEYK